ncbi:hypothetical protein Sru01_10770 [Sphaerisporangium rufum]|uniref:MHYT domain-containing protein n=1 Tax=Sphaerisporangium rufum TaxID=1381558 RepID=A0A919V3A1_9ACTN|nr:MHYT domain-containing protein [Sphaerisporangium rufum]GII76095.1 hypothetical protein Sru01_10770 [Sphaerisporangium rufum]
MGHINHFSQGAVTPVAAYVMSVLGSLLGLLLATRARGTAGAARTRWLAAAALAIGGTGIWVMHFIAMMGFSVPGAQIRYDVPLTVLSAAVAVLMVGVGLGVVAWSRGRPAALVAGGLLTGLGVAGMHYMGMAAMHLPAAMDYDPVLVVVSVLIAVAAATVALWFTTRIEGWLPTTGAALIMGVAVCGMHYTGMFSLSVSPVRPQAAGAEHGATALSFLLPLLVLISLVTLALLLVVLLSPSRQELESENALLARLEARRAADAAGPGPHPPAAPAGPPADSLFRPPAGPGR